MAELHLGLHPEREEDGAVGVARTGRRLPHEAGGDGVAHRFVLGQVVNVAPYGLGHEVDVQVNKLAR